MNNVLFIPETLTKEQRSPSFQSTRDSPSSRKLESQYNCDGVPDAWSFRSPCSRGLDGEARVFALPGCALRPPNGRSVRY